MSILRLFHANRTAGSGRGTWRQRRLSTHSPPYQPFILPSTHFIFSGQAQPLSSSSPSIRKAGSPTKQGAWGGGKPLSKLPGSISSASCWDCVPRGCGKLDLGFSLSTSVHEIRVHCVALTAECFACVCLRGIACSASAIHCFLARSCVLSHFLHELGLYWFFFIYYFFCYSCKTLAVVWHPYVTEKTFNNPKHNWQWANWQNDPFSHLFLISHLRLTFCLSKIRGLS